jgi:putative ABC transport system permease protein
MKYFHLVLSAVMRRKVRTLFTCLSIIVAFLLYGVLHGVTSGFDEVIGQMSQARLRIQNRAGMTRPLPIRYVSDIEKIAHVEHVAYVVWLDTYFRDPQNSVQASAVDMQRLVAVSPDVVLPPGAVAAMRGMRTGAIVGQDLARQYGWTVGTRVTLRSKIWVQANGSPDWAFDILGLYSSTDRSSPSNEFWVNYDYFDEARARGKGWITMLLATDSGGAQSSQVTADIDAHFRNSPDQTYTQNDRDWMRSLIGQIGNLDVFVAAIVGAVLFALLFLTTNTMMQSINERLPELAVLKVFGFGDSLVAALVVVESLLICITGAAIGLLAASFLVPILFNATGFGIEPMPINVLVLGAGLAAVVALVSALAPMLRLKHLRVIDAIAGR